MFLIHTILVKKESLHLVGLENGQSNTTTSSNLPPLWNASPDSIGLEYRRPVPEDPFGKAGTVIVKGLAVGGDAMLIHAMDIGTEKVSSLDFRCEHLIISTTFFRFF